MNKLIDYIKKNSLSGSEVSVCLMCAKGKEGFYEKLGFVLDLMSMKAPEWNWKLL